MNRAAPINEKSATARGSAVAMLHARESQFAPHAVRQGDKWEFRLLLALAVGCFFVVSLFTRLLPRGLRPFAAPAHRRESCFEEARRVAYAVIPYAFEW